MNIDLLTPGDEPNEKTIHFVCINCGNKQDQDIYCDECEHDELIEDDFND